MSQFIFPYAGNKRKEAKWVIKLIPEDITMIIEPFCGTSAMSFDAYKYFKAANKTLKFILNDSNEELINVYNLLKQETVENIIRNVQEIADKIKTKEEFLELFQTYKQTKDIYLYIFFMKYSSKASPGFFNGASRSTNKTFKLTKLQLEFIDFIKDQNVKITNEDWKETYETNKHQSACFLIDPPYLLSHNSFYTSKSTNVYEYFSYNKRPENVSLFFILEENWITNLLFKDYEKFSYSKNYDITRRETKHIIYYLL